MLVEKELVIQDQELLIRHSHYVIQKHDCQSVAYCSQSGSASKSRLYDHDCRCGLRLRCDVTVFTIQTMDKTGRFALAEFSYLSLHFWLNFINRWQRPTIVTVEHQRRR